MDRLFTTKAALAALVLLGMLFFLVILVHWQPSPPQSFSGQRIWPWLNPTVSNLFLKIKIRVDEMPTAKPFDAYLRVLGLKNASVVAYGNFKKGDKIVLFLDSLPEFPHEQSQIRGTIVNIKALGGTPKSFLVDLRFVSIDDGLRLPLVKYLTYLGDHHKVAVKQV